MKTTRKADGRPAFQFYPADWLGEPGLRMCSLSARGLWIDLLAFMFSMPFRGELRHANHSPLTVEEAARLVGQDSSTTVAALEELLVYHVAERSSDGAIYSRRMVRDEKVRHSKVLAGAKGGKRKSELAKQGSSSSSPSSSSTSSSETEIVCRVIERLNEKTGTRYRAGTVATRKHILARLRDGFTEADLLQVVDKMVSEWKGDPEMEKYLRPQTLFRPSKFEGYLNRKTKADHQAERLEEMKKLTGGDR
jgi:uncharacterized phage protein (TIGR02220 family)